MSRQGVFRSRQSLVKDWSFYVAIEYLCVATEFGLGQGTYVATNCFYAMTKFGQAQEFLCRDKIFLSRDKIILCHDRVWSKLGISLW